MTGSNTRSTPWFQRRASRPRTSGPKKGSGFYAARHAHTQPEASRSVNQGRRATEKRYRRTHAPSSGGGAMPHASATSAAELMTPLCEAAPHLCYSTMDPAEQLYYSSGSYSIVIPGWIHTPRRRCLHQAGKPTACSAKALLRPCSRASTAQAPGERRATVQAPVPRTSALLYWWLGAT